MRKLRQRFLNNSPAVPQLESGRAVWHPTLIMAIGRDVIAEVECVGAKGIPESKDPEEEEEEEDGHLQNTRVRGSL